MWSVRCRSLTAFCTLMFSLSPFSPITCCFSFFPRNSTQLVSALRLLVIPFNGAGLTYGSLVCADSLWHVRPALKDPWAFNLSLLAIRSPLIHSTANFKWLPLVQAENSRLISWHRDPAAVDFWNGRHLPDGTLTPLSSLSS